MKVQFKQWKCIAKGEYYGNGRKAVSLIDAEDGEPIATATVNVVAVDHVPEMTAFIKDYSENEGMSQALINAGIIHKEIYGMTKSGFVTIHLYRFTDKALKELWGE